MDRPGCAPRQGDKPLPDGGAEWGCLGCWAAKECCQARLLISADNDQVVHMCQVTLEVGNGRSHRDHLCSIAGDLTSSLPQFVALSIWLVNEAARSSVQNPAIAEPYVQAHVAR